MPLNWREYRANADLAIPSWPVSHRALLWHVLALQADFSVQPARGSDPSIPLWHRHIDWQDTHTQICQKTNVHWAKNVNNCIKLYHVTESIWMLCAWYKGFICMNIKLMLTWPGPVLSQTVEFVGQPPLFLEQESIGVQDLPSPSKPVLHVHCICAPLLYEQSAFMLQTSLLQKPEIGRERCNVKNNTL